MNKNEKRAVLLIFFLFSVGLAARYIPWTLPEVGESSVDLSFLGETLHTNESFAIPEADSGSVALTSDFEKPKEHKAKKSKPKVKLPVSINSASADALCAIPGVGPKLAEKIIAFRKAKGPLKNAADLKKVPGIGEKKSKNILPNVIFD